MRWIENIKSILSENATSDRLRKLGRYRMTNANGQWLHFLTTTFMLKTNILLNSFQKRSANINLQNDKDMKNIIILKNNLFNYRFMLWSNKQVSTSPDVNWLSQIIYTTNFKRPAGIRLSCINLYSSLYAPYVILNLFTTNTRFNIRSPSFIGCITKASHNRMLRIKLLSLVLS